MEKRQRAVNRKDRVPFGGHQTKLQLSEFDAKSMAEKGYVVRWFNDQDGRIERAIQGGWTFVDPEDVPSTGARTTVHGENSDLNSKVSKVVSRGADPIRAYLLKINKDWYDEDQASKEAINSKVDQALRPTEQGGQTIEGGYTPI